MAKRFKDYKWQELACKRCGMKQLVADQPHKLRKCNVHCPKPRKCVRGTAEAISRTLEEMGVQVQQIYQEFPLGTRRVGKHTCGDYSKELPQRIDFVYQVADRLFAVDVHGGNEHKYKEPTRKRDAQRMAAWDEEVQHQADDAFLRCVGTVLTIWAPKLVPTDQGGPVTAGKQWKAYVRSQVMRHVQKYVLD